MIETSNKNVDS